MNYLEKVKEFRAATGLDSGQSVELHDKLIREELAETASAIANYDGSISAKSLIADGYADTVVVLCGKTLDGYISESDLDIHISCIMKNAADRGINLEVAFNIVHASNMSKLCTEDELEPTMQKYNKLGVAVEFRQISDGLFACYSLIGTDDYPAGKLLKSVGFKEPDWSGEDWLL